MQNSHRVKFLTTSQLWLVAAYSIPSFKKRSGVSHRPKRRRRLRAVYQAQNPIYSIITRLRRRDFMVNSRIS
ncbi:hypothetical protein EDD18DRAFT_1131141 [Armillaria luteobubalina]|uniref:Uncharacterized protein n=1 Tax=Armillaria luteobubalina TaxID=153913 RepID=A0AA39QKZ2_9AGAR|nr:hypothetical protein EDD18DRAFT_1131141 [Armillaria luteobubalina]